MTVLVGKDGANYDIPDANAQAAIASGQFTAPPTAPVATPQATPAPEAAASPAASAGADAASAAAPDVSGLSESAKHVLDVTSPGTGPLVGEDGSLYDFPAANREAALASGKFRQQGAEESRVERQGATGLKEYIGGTADALLTGFSKANPVPLNTSETASQKSQIASEVEQVSAEHPIATTGGELTGEVGKAILSGGIAGAATKAAGLTGFAKAAAEGAIFSAEPVAKAIINKDPAGSAEALALGIGLNVALHGAFEGIAKLPKLAAEGIEKTQGFLKDKYVPKFTAEEAENKIGRELGLTTKQIAEGREQLAPAIKAAGITADDIANRTAFRKIQKLEESGPEIGKAIKELDTYEGKAPIIEEHLSNAATEIREKLLPPEVIEKESAEASLEAGKRALKGLEDSTERVTPLKRAAYRDMVAKAEERLAAVGRLSPLAEQASKTLDPFLRQLESAAEKGTFEETQALKRFVGEQTNFSDNKFVNTTRQRAAGIIRENLARAEDAVGEKLGTPEVTEGLRIQRALYGYHKLLGDAADKIGARQAPEELSHLFGSHATGSGHMLPHAVLHLFGVPAGINAALAVTGVPQLVKGYIAKQQLRGAAAKLLGESTAPTTNTLVHALEQQDLRLSDSVKGLFASFGTREAEHKALDTSGGLRGFVEDANGRSHAQQLTSLQRLVTQAQSDPATFAARLEHVVAPLRAEGHEAVAQAFTDHQLRLMKVLQAILPKDPNLLAKAHSFTANVGENEIEPATKTRYQRALTIAADPGALLHLIKNNMITQGDVAIAAAVNPSTLQKLRNEVIKEGLKAKPDLSYQQRLSMGILLGAHIDQSTEQVPALQSVYAGQGGAPAPSRPKKSGRLSAGASANLTNAPLTLSQQAAGHSR